MFSPRRQTLQLFNLFFDLNQRFSSGNQRESIISE
jgi:hypothetical protein